MKQICYVQGNLGRIYGELLLPEGAGPHELVVLSHGFGGDGRGNEDVADYFASKGFAVYNFDFCGGGYGSRSDGDMLDMTVLTEAEDLSAVIDAFRLDARFSGISLWGASQGGFVSAYVAARRPDDVKKLVLEFPAIVLQDDARARANADGSFPATSTVFGNVIGRKYNEDATSFDLYDRIGAYPHPVLILHGDADLIVPLSYSQRAVNVFPDAELIVMKACK